MTSSGKDMLVLGLSEHCCVANLNADGVDEIVLRRFQSLLIQETWTSWFPERSMLCFPSSLAWRTTPKINLMTSRFF